MSDSSTRFRVGGATVDITPPVGVYLAGFAARNEPSDGIDHPLRATVTVLQDGDDAPLILVSAEWLGFYDRTVEMRRRLLAALATAFPGQPVDAARIVLAATHTHYAPTIRAEVDVRRHGAVDEEYIDRTLAALAEAAVAAMRRREACRLRFGTGRCDFAASRRKPDGAGGVTWAPTYEAPHDHDVPVLVAETPEGALRHLLFGYTAHPTAGGSVSRRIGGDYAGFALAALDAAFPGATVSFLQGCAGDQKPYAPTVDGSGFRHLAVEEIRRLGEELAAAVARVIDASALTPITGALAAAREFITLYTALPAEEELRAALDSPQAYEQEWARHLLELIARSAPLPSEHAFEIQGIRFGDDLAMVTLSGEMTVEHQLRIKRTLAPVFRHVFVVAYTNAIVGYVPVRRQIPEGGYEVVMNNRHQRYAGPFAPDTEERIHAAVGRVLGLPTGITV